MANVRLMDAHSFCWLLGRLRRDGRIGRDGNDYGRVLSGRETSIIEMRDSVKHTVGNAHGQSVVRTLKKKEQRMTDKEMLELIESLLDRQDDRCALTGIPFHFHGPDVDVNLKPSVDRIDSDGHYEVGNLQIVCRFINFWKADAENEEFKRLLMLVRGEDGVPGRLEEWSANVGREAELIARELEGQLK